MSVATAGLPHYRPDGDLYDQVPRVVWTLERTYLRSAVLVCGVVLNADKRGELDGSGKAEALTNREVRRRIEAETGISISLSSVKKGFYALHRVLGEKGLAIIDRIRQHGRRVINLVRGIRQSGAARSRDRANRSSPPSALPLREEKYSGDNDDRGPVVVVLRFAPGGGIGGAGIAPRSGQRRRAGARDEPRADSGVGVPVRARAGTPGDRLDAHHDAASQPRQAAPGRGLGREGAGRLEG